MEHAPKIVILGAEKAILEVEMFFYLSGKVSQCISWIMAGCRGGFRLPTQMCPDARIQTERGRERTQRLTGKCLSDDWHTVMSL